MQKIQLETTMKLEIWCKENCIQYKSLSVKLNISRYTLYNWRRGRCEPNAEQLVKIWQLTNGQVSLMDFVETTKAFRNRKKDQ